MLTSKEVLEKTGISRATLNNYIGWGIVPKPQVLPPQPQDGAAPRIGYFPDEIVDRIADIQRLKSEGWSMARITERFSAEPTAARGNHPSARRPDGGNRSEPGAGRIAEAVDRGDRAPRLSGQSQLRNRLVERGGAIGRPCGFCATAGGSRILEPLQIPVARPIRPRRAIPRPAPALPSRARQGARRQPLQPLPGRATRAGRRPGTALRRSGPARVRVGFPRHTSPSPVRAPPGRSAFTRFSSGKGRCSSMSPGRRGPIATWSSTTWCASGCRC